MRKTVISICEAIITWLDPIRVNQCRLTTSEVAMSLKGYLPPNKWNHVSFTMSAWLQNNEDDTSASFDDVSLKVNGDVKQRQLAHLKLSNGSGVSIGIGETVDEVTAGTKFMLRETPHTVRRVWSTGCEYSDDRWPGRIFTSVGSDFSFIRKNKIL